MTSSELQTPDRSLFLLCAGPDRTVRQRISQPTAAGPAAVLLSWNDGETEAFARFHSPDALAVSLSAGGTEQRDAEAAMQTIRQVRTSYWDWFGDPELPPAQGGPHPLDLAPGVPLPEATRRGARPPELGTADRLLRNANKSPQPKRQSLPDLARQNLRGLVCKGLFVSPSLRLSPSSSWERFSGNCTGQVPDQSLVNRVMSRRPFAF